MSILCTLLACGDRQPTSAEAPAADVSETPRLSHIRLPAGFEPSGLVQAPGAEVALVADDSRHGQLLGFRLDFPGPRLDFLGAWPLAANPPPEDLEGLTAEPVSGHIYATASHAAARGSSGDYLIRVTAPPGQSVRLTGAIQGIGGILRRRYPQIRAVAEMSSEAGGLNVEAVAFDPSERRLLLGLRSPLGGAGDRAPALVVPVRFMDEGGEFRLENLIFPTELTEIDLGGSGIRAMEYDPVIGAFLVVSGGSRNRGEFNLWSWSGRADERPERLTRVKFEAGWKPEGIARLRFADRSALVVVDDGGGYIVVPDALLQ